MPIQGRLPLFLAIAAVVAVVAGFALTPTQSVRGEEPIAYAGSRKCKTCHADQHTAWEKMKHSKAWDSLTPEQIATGKDDKGRACVQCHTTGYGKPGGFTTAEETPNLKSVGCEMCHGAGKKHVKTMTMAMMNEEENVKEKFISKGLSTCTDCHNPHISYKEKYGTK